jgi:hypothetical protein
MSQHADGGVTRSKPYAPIEKHIAREELSAVRAQARTLQHRCGSSRLCGSCLPSHRQFCLSSDLPHPGEVGTVQGHGVHIGPEGRREPVPPQAPIGADARSPQVGGHHRLRAPPHLGIQAAPGELIMGRLDGLEPHEGHVEEPCLVVGREVVPALRAGSEDPGQLRVLDHGPKPLPQVLRHRLRRLGPHLGGVLANLDGQVQQGQDHTGPPHCLTNGPQSFPVHVATPSWGIPPLGSPTFASRPGQDARSGGPGGHGRLPGQAGAKRSRPGGDHQNPRERARNG